MSQNSYGIYVEDLERDSLSIKTLADGFKTQGDVVLFWDSDQNTLSHQYAIFPSFYVKFFRGTIVFLSVENYMVYKDQIIGKPMLYIEKNNFKNLDRSIIQTDNIIYNEQV